MQSPATQSVVTPLSAQKSASTMLSAPRSFARMAAEPYRALTLREKASIPVVFPAPRKPLTIMYLVLAMV